MDSCIWIPVETGDEAESVPRRFTAACTPRTRSVPRGGDMSTCSYCGRPTRVIYGHVTTADERAS
jgi:hypothetical protein